MLLSRAIERATSGGPTHYFVRLCGLLCKCIAEFWPLRRPYDAGLVSEARNGLLRRADQHDKRWILSPDQMLKERHFSWTQDS